MTVFLDVLLAITAEIVLAYCSTLSANGWMARTINIASIKVPVRLKRT